MAPEEAAIDATRRRLTTRTLTGTAVLLALGVMLPIAFHGIPLGGRLLLPMHIPTLIAGLLLGPVAGLVVGAGSPLLSSLTPGGPPPFYMVPMLFELTTYGVVSGLARSWLERAFGAATSLQAAPSAATRPRPVPALILSLLIAMLAGRAVWIGVVVWLAPLIGLGARSAAAALAALGAGWVGMAVQLALIPPIVRAIERMRVA